MTTIDVFNGDADGICALHQLRLAEPRDSVLITGVKRDIALVAKIPDASSLTEKDELTILDISLDKNREALLPILENGVDTRYFDHHFPGEVPERNNFAPFIDTDPTTCTGLIVDRYLDGAHRAWAVVAAFGDNLFDSAEAAAAKLSIGGDRLTALRTLGTLINYNGYGADLDDLYFPPADLYQRVKPYADPFDFIANDAAFEMLDAGYKSDRERVEAIDPTHSDDSTAVYILPNDAFARRIGGVYANELAQRHPSRAHALLTLNAKGNYVVSVRAPLDNRTGADDLCRQFDTGGGRKAAAGINQLPPSEVDRFIAALNAQYSR